MGSDEYWKNKSLSARDTICAFALAALILALLFAVQWLQV